MILILLYFVVIYLYGYRSAVAAPEGAIMTKQIGSDLPKSPLTYYVIETNSRRILVPDTKDGTHGFHCITITNCAPQPNDVHVKGQKHFEKILEDMHLLSKWSPTRILGRIWITKGDASIRVVDDAVAKRIGKSEEFKTWMPLLK
jgi:hypothetical protein